MAIVATCSDRHSGVPRDTPEKSHNSAQLAQFRVKKCVLLVGFLGVQLGFLGVQLGFSGVQLEF